MSLRISPIFQCIAEGWRRQDDSPISPLAGEMSGRTEGGVTERYLREALIAGIA